MRVTVLGHAGLFVETAGPSVLCDPWFVPAFHGSWYVFPRNDGLDVSQISSPDLLYISHLHSDHLDATFLRSNVDKGATVLLPDLPTPELEEVLRDIGFTRFIRCPDGAEVDLGGAKARIYTETSPTDGPLGDSALWLSDGTGAIFDQNDCRPTHLEEIRSLGPLDIHLLQYSGAMWWPVVYEMPEDERRRIGAAKREAQLSRATMYASALGAAAVVPSAGPPCFLDPEQRHLNDVDSDPSNIFPDATVFLERLDHEGIPGVLAVPGTVLEVAQGGVEVRHPMPAGDVAAIFADKGAYLDSYARDWSGWLERERSSWPSPRPDLVGRIAEWWEPLLASAPRLRAAVGRSVLLRCGDEDILVDFPAGVVRTWQSEEIGYRLDLPRPLVERCVEERAVDWSNSLMLSLRFQAWRPGEFCEELFSFLKSLNPQRLAVLESNLAELDGPDEADEVLLGGRWVQRRCPHRQADLEHFGEVDGCNLTCTMHGWRFDLDTGECFTSRRHKLRTRPADGGEGTSS